MAAKYQTVFWLRYFAELSISETAECCACVGRVFKCSAFSPRVRSRESIRVEAKCLPGASRRRLGDDRSAAHDTCRSNITRSSGTCSDAGGGGRTFHLEDQGHSGPNKDYRHHKQLSILNSADGTFFNFQLRLRTTIETVAAKDTIQNFANQNGKQASVTFRTLQTGAALKVAQK